MGPKSLRFLLRRLPQLSPLAQAGGRAPATVGSRLWQHLRCARFKGCRVDPKQARFPDAPSTSVLQLPISNGAKIHASSYVAATPTERDPHE